MKAKHAPGKPNHFTIDTRKNLAAGFGVRVLKDLKGNYAMIENGYESEIDADHARRLCAHLGGVFQ